MKDKWYEPPSIATMLIAILILVPVTMLISILGFHSSVEEAILQVSLGATLAVITTGAWTVLYEVLPP